MKITAKLRDFLLGKSWIKSDTSDDDVKKVVGEKLLSGDLTADQFAELTKEAAPTGQQSASDLIRLEVAKSLAPFMSEIKQQLDGLKGTSTTPPPAVPPPAVPPPPAGPVTQADVDKAVQTALEKVSGSGGMVRLLSSSADVLQRPDIRVKSAAEMYSTARKSAIYPERCGVNGTGSKHPMAGRPAHYGTLPLDLPSEQDKAVAGAFYKFALSKSSASEDIPQNLRMNEHDKDLVNWALRNTRFNGIIGGNDEGDGGIKVDRRLLTEVEYKAILDDPISGGIEIVPAVLDEAIITYPVLFGELFPYVNIINVARGRRIHGNTMANPTMTWGVPEGTAIEPINTAGFIGIYDTAIYPCTGAIEIGEDFEEDTAVNVGAYIIQKFGEKALEQLDYVIAVGDGVTQPEGIFTSTAPTVIPSEFGTGGPPSLSDYESLLFGIAKEYRNARGQKNVFVGNDTTYRRYRGIPVAAGYEQRLAGVDYMSYTVLESPYRVQNDIPNNKLAYVNLGYYNMWRRLGLNFRIERNGQQLALKNTRLIICRMRFGGRLMLGGTAVVMTDAEL